MAVGGLVLSFSSDAVQQRAALRRIACDPRLELGPRQGRRLAVVATTDTLGAGHDLCKELLAHPGIENVEVAYVAPEEDVAAEQHVAPKQLAAAASQEGDE